MPGKKGKSGGPRDGAGRPALNRPLFTVRIATPTNDDTQGDYAIKWFKSLTPDERLDRIAEIFDTTGEFHGDASIFDAWLNEKYSDED